MSGFVLSAFFILSTGAQAHAAVLSPGDISTCGELAAPGTYSLTTSVSTTTGAACFTITSNSVVLTSSTTGSYTVTGGISGNGVNPGDPGFNFTVRLLTVTGTTSADGAAFGTGTTTVATTTAGNAGAITIATSTVGAIEANGGANDNLGATSYGGSGGAIVVSSSTVATTTANGGSGSGYGGGGGSVSMTGMAVNIASSSISASGGVGSTTLSGNGANGSLTVNYGSLNYYGAQLSALSDLVLNGPGSVPGDLGPFAGGTLATLPGATIVNAAQCNLLLGGTYTVGANITGNCRVSMNGVILNGSTTSSFTISGSVIGDGLNTGSPGNNFTLTDLTVIGTTSSNGADSNAGNGGAGGSITISSSTVATTTANGGRAPSISVAPSVLFNGGKGGYITVANSTSTLIQANGGTSGTGFNNGNGAGGMGGLVRISSSTAASIQAIGGDDDSFGFGLGGNGGSVYATSSTVSSVQAYGGDSIEGLGTSTPRSGGLGGSINAWYSTTTSLSVNGGEGDAQGGNGGSINLTGDILDLSGMTLSLSGGGMLLHFFAPAQPGRLILNYSTLIRTGVSLPVLSDLVLNGPGGLPGDTGAFAGGTIGTIPGDILTSITQCPLTIGGPYYLDADLTGDCQIKANNVVLDGGGRYTVHGSVIGDGLTAGSNVWGGVGDPGFNFTIQNATITGTTTSDGHDGLASGGSGGSITISSSTVATTTANGGNPGTGPYSAQGGNGGSITIKISTTTSIQADGGPGYYITSSSAVGGNGGTISIATSTTGAVEANGGDSPVAIGGKGGAVSIVNSLARPAGSSVSADGGDVSSSATRCVYGGNGGTVTLASSTYGIVTADPGTTNQSVQSICDQNQSIASHFFGSQSGTSGQVQVVGEYVPSALQSVPGVANPSVANDVEPVSVPGLANVSGGSSLSAVSSAVSLQSEIRFPPGAPGTNGFVSALGIAIGATVRAADKTAGAVVDNPVSKAVETTGFLAGLLAAAALYANAGLAATSTAASGVLLIPIKLWGIVSLGLGIKKRTRPWGTVYDSVTKQPIDPAVVTARDENGKVMAESMTDIDGRYGFLLPPGTYYLSAGKTNYEFPSKKLSDKQSDELYTNLYFGEPVAVGPGEIIDKNIPMDRKDFDWNEQAKKELGLLSFHSKHEKAWSVVGRYVYGAGLVISTIAVVTRTSLYNIAILAAYLLVLILLRFSIKNKKLGRVAYADTGKPLSYAIFRVTTPDHVAVLRSGVCDGDGRYYCIVPKGEYVLDFEKKNLDGSYSPVYESPRISSSSGIINRDFRI